MPTLSDKIMFEIYRESGYNRQYRAVYFTELDEHNKEHEINAALAGEHLHSGFIAGSLSRDAKRMVNNVLARLNAGEPLDGQAVERILAPFSVE